VEHGEKPLMSLPLNEQTVLITRQNLIVDGGPVFN
jgi:hypothetical protein